MNWTLLSFCIGSAFILVTVGLYFLIQCLKNLAFLDSPNERSSHQVPTPKGAGLVLIPVVAALWVLVTVFTHDDQRLNEILGISVLAVLLCGFSWVDDLRELSAMGRLIVHVLAASAGFYFIPGNVLLFQGYLPPEVDHIFLILVWAWFINLFNFMDGIDGISGVQTIGICVGVSIVLLLGGRDDNVISYALILGASVFGFLIWNWPPARIFLGDAGSAPLGFMLGWLLIKLAGSGEWEAALILPLYYLADTTITLLRRLFKGEKVWQGHRQHYYQQPVQNGHSHASVAIAVMAINFLLIASAMLASSYLPILGLACAVLLVGCFLWYLAKYRGAV